MTTGITFTVQNLTIANGKLVDGAGAGISNGGTLTVTNSTFSGNSTYGDGVGGGIVTFGGTLTITNSTFSGNSASGDIFSGGGGGINNVGTLTVTNTIISNSTSGGNCAGYPPGDGGHNVDDGTTCGFTGTSVSNTNPKLDPAGLANNGGPTQTIALQATSPAINAGDESVCSAPPVNNLDQRGFVRPGTGAANCSIGAYEANSPGPLPACVGDCRGDNRVSVDEILTMVNIALGNADMSECEIGDANKDGQITVDEILMAVNNALNGCPLTPEQACLASGGTVTTATCCASTNDFPDTCAIGACGCPPDASHEVRVCDCGTGSCFDGTGCVSQ
ncbi:MAG: choice-of-anchor Q domain-containing protein [Candidatus Binatia bacterium]